MDLKRREEKLVEEAWGLYSFNGRDLSVELEELHERVAGVEKQMLRRGRPTVTVSHRNL
jgi:hypothetical protein